MKNTTHLFAYLALAGWFYVVPRPLPAWAFRRMVSDEGVPLNFSHKVSKS